jgi:hypothetical protein
MIIWINGAFGSGKSETAAALSLRIPGSFMFNPENTGEFLWKNLPAVYSEDCFQEIPLWRAINRDILSYLYDLYTIIVPMTITDTDYFDEIIGSLRRDGMDVRHFTLLAEKATITRRLIQRGDGEQSWAAAQIDRCLKYHPLPVFARHIRNDELTVDEVAGMIYEGL